MVGGAVPRNYIGAVEEGVVDVLLRGPLGFPVIDVQVTLTDGSYHSVDSSDLVFWTAARIGLTQALPQCQPVLLEPIHAGEIVCPTEATAKINAILCGRRGQILGFDTREGWQGWDRVRAMMPEAEIGELIVELARRPRAPAASPAQFDRMAEVSGRAADQIDPRIAGGVRDRCLQELQEYSRRGIMRFGPPNSRPIYFALVLRFRRLSAPR